MWVAVPGLTQTFTVPEGADVYLATDGGLQTNSLAFNGFSIVEIGFSIDGIDPASGPDPFFRRVIAANATVRMISSWSFGRSVPLSVGMHTVQVWARLNSVTGNSAATVSGSSLSGLQGQLTVMILKK